MIKLCTGNEKMSAESMMSLQIPDRPTEHAVTYANAFQHLSQRANIPCVTVNQDDNHGWNEVGALTGKWQGNGYGGL